MPFSGIISAIGVPAPIKELGSKVLGVAVPNKTQAKINQFAPAITGLTGGAPIEGLPSQILSSVPGVPPYALEGANLLKNGLPKAETIPSQIVSKLGVDLGEFAPFVAPEFISSLFNLGNPAGALASPAGGALASPAGGGSTGLAYPGAGDEPQAQYGGYVYNTSTPVVFSITRAEAASMTEGLAALAATSPENFKIDGNETPGFIFGANPFDSKVLSEFNLGGPGSLAVSGVAKQALNDFNGQNFNPSANYNYSPNGAIVDPAANPWYDNANFDESLIEGFTAANLGAAARIPSSKSLIKDFSTLYKETGELTPGTDFASAFGINQKGGVGTASSGGWNFILAPENIRWNTAANPQRVEMFGTNSPPVVGGGRGMRDLELSGAIVEGFTRSRQVEDKVQQLEFLMDYELSAGNPFVNVPVYQVTANEKVYGDGLNSKDGGYFIIKDISVEETIRDFTGRATRAVVDVSFMQVPKYQVESGIDQASESVTGATSPLKTRGDQYETAVKRQEEMAAKQAEQAKTAKGGTTGSGKWKAGRKKDRQAANAPYGFWVPEKGAQPVPATRAQKLQSTGSDAAED